MQLAANKTTGEQFRYQKQNWQKGGMQFKKEAAATALWSQNKLHAIDLVVTKKQSRKIKGQKRCDAIQQGNSYNCTLITYQIAQM